MSATRSYGGPSLLIVGWDAGCWEYLKPHIDRGHLPELAALRERGTYGTLESTLPALTAVAWTTIGTGCNPGKHGIFSWWRATDHSYDLCAYNSTSRKVPHLLERLSAAGLTVGGVGIPMTAPPFPVNGFLIGGIGNPNSAEDWRLDKIYPTELLHDLRRRHPEAMKFDSRVMESATSNVELLGIWRNFEHHRLNLIEDLVSTKRPDVLWVHCHVGDYFGHREPRESPVIKDAFSVVDRTIGHLRRMSHPGATVLVVSDHGQTPIDRFLLLQNFLEQQGWLQFNKQIAKQRFGQTMIRLLKATSNPHERDDVVLAVRSVGSAYYNLPDLHRSVFGEAVELLIPGASKDHHNIDWRQSHVYSFEPGGLIRVNLQGREPNGIVPQREYDALVEQIREAVEAIEDPETGAPLGIRTYRGSEIYVSEEQNSRMPDLVLEMSDPTILCCNTHALHLGHTDCVVPIDHDSLSQQFRFLDQEYYGDHTRHGIYVIADPHAVALGEKPTLRAEDVVPTVLHHFGLEIPTELDGIVRADLM